MSPIKRAANATNRCDHALVVRRSGLGRSRARVQVATTSFSAVVGRGGIASLKREGDGATPRATMRMEYAFYRSDRLIVPASRLRLIPIRGNLGWCDAPYHPLYNRPVLLPFAASHETMMRADRLYDICIVLDWNRGCRRRGAGSAIFLHLARPGFTPTEGCIAVGFPAMHRILSVAWPGMPVVVI